MNQHTGTEAQPEGVDAEVVEPVAADGSLPSCDGCRLRKLKCSREKPSCSNCKRLGTSCSYDLRRNKPGLKSGVVESLNRRLEAVERKLLHSKIPGSSLSVPGTGVLLPHEDPVGRPDTPLTSGDAAHVLGGLNSLAQEIRYLSQNVFGLARSVTDDGLKSRRPGSPQPLNERNQHPGKRRRLDTEQSQEAGFEADSKYASEQSSNLLDLLPDKDLDALLTAYFANVHPWIPMIHASTFRRTIRERLESGEIPLIMHAIIVAALGLVETTNSWLTPDRIDEEVERSRDKVMQRAVDGLSVEKLQALIIIAFTHIGNGQPERAWAVVGCLTRAVEYLHLSVEEADFQAPQAPLAPEPLPPPVNWIEEEERRRVFWNVFILDRICSICTGWNIGLTADNVSRRLPICGTHWNDLETPAITPYFGMWDKSAAKMGNSIAFLPAHYPSPGQSTESGGAEYENSIYAGLRRSASSGIDMSTVGAFAYYVESLESLCRINVYFLQQRVNFNNRQEVSNWLTRFKELDLRLVHWKMCLPHKWKDPSVPPEETNVLDPNMTLAHITHNTSMIMLHQRIGYPVDELKSIKLPSFYSAETCQSAAVETANITREYLARTRRNMPISPHYSFCAFISARVLLVHWRYYGVELEPLFHVLIECLDEIARRWVGQKTPNPERIPPLSGQLAVHLGRLYDRCRRDPTYQVSVLENANGTTPRPSQRDVSATHQSSSRSFPREHIASPAERVRAASSSGGATSPAQRAPSVTTPDRGPGSDSARRMASWSSPSNHSGIVLAPLVSETAYAHDGLSNILQTLTDQRFVELDRVISFDDMNFNTLSSNFIGMTPADDSGWNNPAMPNWPNDRGPH